MLYLFILSLTLFQFYAEAYEPFKIHELRVQQLLEKDAFGIDTASPVLAWSYGEVNSKVDQSSIPSIEKYTIILDLDQHIVDNSIKNLQSYRSEHTHTHTYVHS